MLIKQKLSRAILKAYLSSHRRNSKGSGEPAHGCLKKHYITAQTVRSIFSLDGSIICLFPRLVEEVSEISETVESLQAKLRQAENSLQQLLRTKAALEQDLSIKNNSIFLDREKCLGMRKTFPMSPRVVSL